jgi:hypothetical protein
MDLTNVTAALALRSSACSFSISSLALRSSDSCAALVRDRCSRVSSWCDLCVTCSW